MTTPKRPRKTPLRSQALFGDEGSSESDAPFRHSFTMLFPPAQQRALRMLAKMLYFEENLKDEHFPLFRGSHNLAHLRAAILDVLSIARSLAHVASFRDTERSQREHDAAGIADRFSVRLARLAAELSAAMDEVAPPKGNPESERLRRKAPRPR